MLHRHYRQRAAGTSDDLSDPSRQGSELLNAIVVDEIFVFPARWVGFCRCI